MQDYVKIGALGNLGKLWVIFNVRHRQTNTEYGHIIDKLWQRQFL